MSVPRVQNDPCTSKYVDFWNDILVPKFIRWKHILVHGLTLHSDLIRTLRDRQQFGRSSRTRNNARRNTASQSLLPRVRWPISVKTQFGLAGLRCSRNCGDWATSRVKILIVERYCAGDQEERSGELAREVVRTGPDVIVSLGIALLSAFKTAKPPIDSRSFRFEGRQSRRSHAPVPSSAARADIPPHRARE